MAGAEVGAEIRDKGGAENKLFWFRNTDLRGPNLNKNILQTEF